jgi:hypothetical protein
LHFAHPGPHTSFVRAPQQQIPNSPPPTHQLTTTPHPPNSPIPNIQIPNPCNRAPQLTNYTSPNPDRNPSSPWAQSKKSAEFQIVDLFNPRNPHTKVLWMLLCVSNNNSSHMHCDVLLCGADGAQHVNTISVVVQHSDIHLKLLGTRQDKQPTINNTHVQVDIYFTSTM